jgi:DNA-binding XRE family transcriptional regulator
LAEFKISLAAARVNAGLTQDDVARVLKVGKQTIVSWEKGKSEPKMSQSRQLSELYKMPLDYIFLPEKSN